MYYHRLSHAANALRYAMSRLCSAIVLVSLFALTSQPLHAVLKEKNLSTTISVLRSELATACYEQKQNLVRYHSMTNAQHKEMVSLMQKSDLISLMLYSQKQDFTFDMTYACHEATTLYRDFNQKRMPYKQILSRLESELTRYNALISALNAIPPQIGKASALPPDSLLPEQLKGLKGQGAGGKQLPFMLDAQGRADRDSCLYYAQTLRDNIVQLRKEIIEDNDHYKQTGEKLKRLNDYALGRYQSIQRSIFVNGDASYFEVLGAFSQHLNNAKEDVDEKYGTEALNHGDKGSKVRSQWRGPIVTGLAFFVLFYILVSAGLSFAIIKGLLPFLQRKFHWFGEQSDFKAKAPCYTLALAMVIFAVSVMIARTAMNHNFFLMASKLLIEYAWLLFVIFVSLLVRISGENIKKGFAVYIPMILMSFLVITFRIIFIPNNLVQLIFPPILLLFTIWQFVETRKRTRRVKVVEGDLKKKQYYLPGEDRFYAWATLIVMAVSTAVAWYGYTLLSVQMLIWWMFQLSCIQTVTCLYEILSMVEESWLEKKIERAKKENAAALKAQFGTKTAESGKKSNASQEDTALAHLQNIRKRHEKFINLTWHYDFVALALVPVLGVLSVLFSIWWAANVFDLTETVVNIFLVNFLNVEGVVQLSLFKIVLAGSLYFIFRYLDYLIKSLYHKYHKSKVVVNGKPNFTLADNIIAICVWGLYAIIAIKMLKIPATAVSYISAGLATGIGFAMKDLLENFFYGISLMSGRVRVGDYIECDGIRGEVDTITYQSTQIITADGCTIAFLNSSLFSKNFKNITKNHSYELVSIPVGVAYGCNVEQVRQILINALAEFKERKKGNRYQLQKDRNVGVVFSDFGDNSVNLLVTYWVLVEDKFAVSCEIKEAIYNALQANDIEIPFPQRDLHLRSADKELLAQIHK